jgi:hypothetical protein
MRYGRSLPNEVYAGAAPAFSRRAALASGAALLASCATTRRGLRDDARLSPWDISPGAFEHGDSARSSVFPTVDPFAAAGAEAAAVPAPFPMPGLWSVAFDRRGMGYALHGVIAGAPGADRARLSAFDPHTLAENWRIDLPMADGPFWNYPGGIGVLANGALYAAYATRLARIAPDTGAVLAVADLPAPAGLAHTAYNGFIALPDGRLLAKSHHRKADCPHSGYRALIECGVEGLPPSALVVLDADDLSVLWRGDAPEFVGGRVSTISHAGRDYVYLAGATSVHRYGYSQGSLTLDASWGPVRYCDGDETPGTAVVGFGDYVVVQNNAIPARTPMRLTVISQRKAPDLIAFRPFDALFAGKSFMPSKPTADWARRRIYTSEAHGALAALDFDRRLGLRQAWAAPVKTGSFLTALGPSQRRVLVASDIGAAPYDAFGAPTHDMERAVWLDADCGALLSEIVGLPRNFGLTLTPFADGSIFYATRAAGLWRLRPARPPVF